MARTFAPAPYSDPIAITKIDGQEHRGFMPSSWVRYFTDLVNRTSQSFQRLASVTKTGQSASISASSVPIGSVTAGLWQVSYYVRVTQAATTSSSIQVSMTWTDGGTVVTHTGTALTGNTTATHEEWVGQFYVDAATVISYATTYASSGATAMKYQLLITAAAVTA